MPRISLSLILLTAFLITACQHTDLIAMDNNNDNQNDKPAHHTKDGFRNLYIDTISKGPIGFLKMRFFGDDPYSDQAAEAHKVPIAEPDIPSIHKPADKPQVTWLGHSTFLIQYKGKNILTDPILSNRASPVRFAGPERLVDMPIKRQDLPPIDYVIISHNHYDHLDRQTVEMFGDEPIYLVPLKLREWFIEEGIDPERVYDLDWWEEFKDLPANLTFTATPCQHWSARGLYDRYQTLWAAWHIQIDDFSIWFGGDTGYNDVQFKEIGEKWGEIDLGLIPIGAYAPRWFMKAQHVDPDEAIQIHQDINAKQSIGMHWGTFQLTFEPIMEPAERINKAVEDGRLKEDEFITLAVGETLLYEAKEDIIPVTQVAAQ